MENRIRIKMMGLSYNPLRNGAFALLLSAEGSNKRIPVIIGAPEAQAIALALESITPPRPMTHDLFVSFARAYDVKLKEVFIYDFEDGIFSAEMTFSDGERTISLDARTSDAIAIAIRTASPIYTTQEILETTGIEIAETENIDNDESETPDTESDVLSNGLTTSNYETMTEDELAEALATAVEEDNFEEAAIIQRYIDRKKQSPDDDDSDDNTNNIIYF